MRRILLPLLLACATDALAGDYPLGTLTCDDMGRFASEVMTDKKAGRSKEDALAALDTRTYGDPVEKNNMTDVVYILYGNLGRNLGVASAGAVIRTDCEMGRKKAP
jgi:hypothetical protein